MITSGAMAAKHKDLEFHVEFNKETQIFKDSEKALSVACALSLTRGGAEVIVDVVCWSRAAAKAFAGDDGAEYYDDDPERSVFERVIVRCSSQGGIA